MNRGFTLLEMVVATALTASLAISCVSWLNRLQQQSETASRQAEATVAVMRTATRLHQDLLHHDSSIPPDLRALQLVSTAAAGATRQDVRWRLVDRTAVREVRDHGGMAWNAMPVAAPIDAMRAYTDDHGRLRVRVSAGDVAWDGPVFPQGDHAP